MAVAAPLRRGANGPVAIVAAGTGSRSTHQARTTVMPLRAVVSKSSRMSSGPPTPCGRLEPTRRGAPADASMTSQALGPLTGNLLQPSTNSPPATVTKLSASAGSGKRPLLLPPVLCSSCGARGGGEVCVSAGGGQTPALVPRNSQPLQPHGALPRPAGTCECCQAASKRTALAARLGRRPAAATASRRSVAAGPLMMPSSLCCAVGSPKTACCLQTSCWQPRLVQDSRTTPFFLAPRHSLPP